MKSIILNLNGVKVLTKNNLKQINGGMGGDACISGCVGGCDAQSGDNFGEFVDCALDCYDLCDVPLFA